MRNIAMVIGYDGTGYSGYQTQPSGNTIQDKLEAAVRALTGETVKIHGSGRTDAGVHAKAQVVHFHTESRIPAERWSLALNTRLPDDIVVYKAWEAPLEFHSRKSAKRKTYRYCIQNSRFPDLEHRRTRLHHPMPLDTAAMRQALACIVGEHDFTSFCTVRCEKDSRVRTIYAAELIVIPDPLPGDDRACSIHIEITGNGFLYNMVRILVGTLIEIGQGKVGPAEMRRILEAQDRSKAGPTAVSHGLTLWRVEYQ
ncbi:tRNA pseudouridine(38-40) synthase TruA [Gorillibacterium sp. sgz5001074]|uniref:tRNA pseudouridine(38-40) synthase TruA n=1 Tax=Gorillibacterium sp. sgz5001074 TaxID=3446695 RepID=UPI003F668FB6